MAHEATLAVVDVELEQCAFGVADEKEVVLVEAGSEDVGSPDGGVAERHGAATSSTTALSAVGLTKWLMCGPVSCISSSSTNHLRHSGSRERS